MDDRGLGVTTAGETVAGERPEPEPGAITDEITNDAQQTIDRQIADRCLGPLVVQREPTDG